MFITALIEVMVALMVGGIIFNLQEKFKKSK
jgi:prepilin-type N-terminal cleavage/methylation domain-containing protein